MIDLFSLLSFTLILAVGQILFKKTGLLLRGVPFNIGVLRVAIAPSFYLAVVLYAFATLLWIWILSRVPLSRAYPFVALGVVLVPIASVFFLGERVRPNFWIGIVLIIVGIFVTQVGALRG